MALENPTTKGTIRQRLREIRIAVRKVIVEHHAEQRQAAKKAKTEASATNAEDGVQPVFSWLNWVLGGTPTSADLKPSATILMATTARETPVVEVPTEVTLLSPKEYSAPENPQHLTTVNTYLEHGTPLEDWEPSTGLWFQHEGHNHTFQIPLFLLP